MFVCVKVERGRKEVKGRKEREEKRDTRFGQVES